MMQYLAYISFAFVLLQLINVLLNFVFNQKLHSSSIELDEMISILIPARNEEQNIGFLLDDLSKCGCEKLEIIVCNDQSTDNTVNIINQYSKNDNRIKLYQSAELPDKWLGKNHACYQLAQKAKGRYFLFLDADVRIFREHYFRCCFLY